MLQEERLKIVEEYTSFSFSYGVVFLVILIIQLLFFVLEIEWKSFNVRLPDRKRVNFTYFLHSFFLTLTFVVFNGLLKQSFAEDKKI